MQLREVLDVKELACNPASGTFKYVVIPRKAELCLSSAAAATRDKIC